MKPVTQVEPVKAVPQAPEIIEPAVVESRPAPQQDMAALNELKAQIEKQSAEFEIQRKEIEAFRSDLRQQNESLAKQNEDLVRKVADLKANLEKLEAEKMTATAVPKDDFKLPNFDRYEADISENRSMIDTQRQTIFAIQEEISKLKEISFEDYIEQEREVLQTLAVEIKGLKDTVTGYDEKIASAR